MLKATIPAVAAVALTLGAGCADDPQTSARTSESSATTSQPTSGSQNTDSNDGSSATGSPSTGSTGAADGTNGTDGSDGNPATPSDHDAGATPITPADCVDDPNTLGNDCPGIVSCTPSNVACSTAEQNCCVKDYKADAASCNQGSACDGLASAGCDGPEDCSSAQVCCISVSVSAGLGADINHRCVPTPDDCTGGLIVNRVLCHTADDCVAGLDCEPIANLPWWGICK